MQGQQVVVGSEEVTDRNVSKKDIELPRMMAETRRETD